MLELATQTLYATRYIEDTIRYYKIMQAQMGLIHNTRNKEMYASVYRMVLRYPSLEFV